MWVLPSYYLCQGVTGPGGGGWGREEEGGGQGHGHGAGQAGRGRAVLQGGRHGVAAGRERLEEVTVSMGRRMRSNRKNIQR